MKKTVRITLGVLVVAGLVFTLVQKNKKSSIEMLREKHQAFLDHSPFAKTKKLSRSERKNLGLPPNAYNEQVWELTMDPNTGRPMPERVYKIQQELKKKRKGLKPKAPGGIENPWIDRGPNNIGGRTRGIMFDPNDTENKRVFAGGVSGGLWVNQDITDANASWTLVPDIGANISVTSIIYDPNNKDVFYIGSGESYTSGHAVGRGIWKSTDKGVTWTNIFGGANGVISNGNQVVQGIFYVNDIVARNVGGVTELYAAIAGANYRHSSNTFQWNGLIKQGLYKSVDNGANWTKIVVNEDNGSPSNPSDIEIDLNNNIWLTTTRSSFGQNGGKIFRSTNGSTFNLINTIPNANRTELEPSKLDVNKFWVAVNVGGKADLFMTTDAFATLTQINEPSDVDEGIPNDDYTRGQAFYDLPIEVGQNDVLYVGGIDLFRSTDEGQTWEQISKWSNNNNLNNLEVPRVHADQHAMVFRPGAGNENQVVLGNDGGVYYTPDFTAAATTLEITARNINYNVTQFYYGAIDILGGSDGDDLVGGTQDNGTPVSINSSVNANSFSDPFTGDGAFTEIDDSGQYMIQSYPFNTHRWINYPTINSANEISTPKTGEDNNGSFINAAVLDKKLDIFYSNASFGGGSSEENPTRKYQIERAVSFIPGSSNPITKSFLSNDVLNAEPVSFQISPYTTTETKLYVGLANSRLLKVDAADSNPVFTNISGAAFVGSISDIEFGQNENELFVTIHNYGVVSVWYTNDGGTSWTAIEGNLPDLPVKCILQNPLEPKELIIGTELGIWKTTDFTASNPVWVQSYNGMSDVTVLDLDLRPSDNTVLASTHGRGLFTGKFTSNTASVEEVLVDQKAFTVYPTVSKGNFTLFAKNSLGKANVNIYDLSGKKVYNANFDFGANEKQQVSVNLSAGVYMVNVIDENNKKSSNKIIIE